MHIELKSDTNGEPKGNWQDEANCLGVDPDLFSRSEAPPLARRRKCAGVASSAWTASSTPS